MEELAASKITDSIINSKNIKSDRVNIITEVFSNDLNNNEDEDILYQQKVEEQMRKIEEEEKEALLIEERRKQLKSIPPVISSFVAKSELLNNESIHGESNFSSNTSSINKIDIHSRNNHLGGSVKMEECKEENLQFKEEILLNHHSAQISVSFDMFSSDSPIIQGSELVSNVKINNDFIPALTDNWDDSEGYYSFKVGDLLDDKYEVFAMQGKGVFSSVLRVRDMSNQKKECVIKVIRKNDIMFKAGQREVELLELLKKNDPDDKLHCIRLFSHFEHKNHFCLVFEAMAMNLREVNIFSFVNLNLR